eukprot:7893435-Pyramimonas_sp.AAC.1
MAALIQGLTELGWQLPEPDTWTDAQQNEWTMDQQPHQHKMHASRELPLSDGQQSDDILGDEDTTQFMATITADVIKE